MKIFPTVAVLACLFLTPAAAETVRIDARAPVPDRVEGYLKMGTGQGPQGTIAINNRYITRDGEPWVPVMGEFHFSRFPARYWEEELLKMKAAGINTVASYIIWNQHELQPGQLDWHGSRDLRRFAQLCARHDLLLFIRPGPWVHAETRHGGLPDWIVQRTRSRSDDPAYLAEVRRFWHAIAGQLQGLLWKDGGPVIGLQVENEYNLVGPGQGAAHIATLKRLALALGLDVPLYTVTAWDRAVYPRGEVAPVVGAYVDEPWSASRSELPPRENYVFRFGSRISAGLGAQTRGDESQRPTADLDRELTPFLGAEYGPGLPVMYRRRPLVAPQDVAATIVTQMGSGLNLLGYYMFHGGANPTANGRGLEETTRSGSHNDVPMIGYDFQAPIGQYGERNAVESHLRPLHFFLEAFGSRLATMTTRAPAAVPASPADLETLRVAVRSEDERGFLFVNNHVRQYATPDHRALRFEVELPDGALRFPSKPVSIDRGRYFFWPFHFDLDGIDLQWATAQPVTRLDDADGALWVFMSTDGVEPEFVFDADDIVEAPAAARREGARLILPLRPSASRLTTLRARDGNAIRLLLLSPAEARQLWVGEYLGERRLLLSEASVMADGDALILRQRGQAAFRLSIWPDPGLAAPLQRLESAGALVRYRATLPAKPTIRVEATAIRDAVPAHPLEMNGPAGTAMQPRAAALASAAAWRFSIPADVLDGVADAWLSIDYRGDVAKLYDDSCLIDDAFWDGRVWTIGLKRFEASLGQPWQLNIVPLHADAPVYFDASVRPDAAAGAQIVELNELRVEPEYELRLHRVAALH